MSFLKKLFGGGGSGGSRAPAVAPVVAQESYQGFDIAAAPVAEAGQYRLAATITKRVGEETRSHHLVRADLFASQDEAARFAVRKAKQVIDEQGDALFGA